MDEWIFEGPDDIHGLPGERIAIAADDAVGQSDAEKDGASLRAGFQALPAPGIPVASRKRSREDSAAGAHLDPLAAGAAATALWSPTNLHRKGTGAPMPFKSPNRALGMSPGTRSLLPPNDARLLVSPEREGSLLSLMTGGPHATPRSHHRVPGAAGRGGGRRRLGFGEEPAPGAPAQPHGAAAAPSSLPTSTVEVGKVAALGRQIAARRGVASPGSRDASGLSNGGTSWTVPGEDGAATPRAVGASTDVCGRRLHIFSKDRRFSTPGESNLFLMGRAGTAPEPLRAAPAARTLGAASAPQSAQAHPPGTAQGVLRVTPRFTGSLEGGFRVVVRQRGPMDH